MTHRLTALSFAALVLVLAVFAASASAGGTGNANGSAGGNGNSASAPGQQKQSTPTQAPAPAAQPAPAAKHESKPSSTSACNPATGGDNSHGVKPSNSTKHDTWAQASSDKTKSYGNGKTAGQIATQAGYGDATLHGPGNSQPHKVLCGGHEVDVHALAHKKNKCGSSTSAPQTVAPAQSSNVQSESTCATTTQTVTERVLVGVQHRTGNGGYVLIHPSTHSAHYSKHADDIPVYETVMKTLSVPTGASCSSTQPTVVSTQVTSAPSVAATVAPATASGTAAATATATPAASTPATATPVSAGGVKGATVTLKPTKTKPAGGVLGTTTRLGGSVASAKLPFTGLSLWIFVLAAAALIAIGATVRRSATRRI
jgi:hypothetical protein